MITLHPCFDIVRHRNVRILSYQTSRYHHQQNPTSHINSHRKLKLVSLILKQQHIVCLVIEQVEGNQQLQLLIHDSPESGKTTVAKTIARECKNGTWTLYWSQLRVLSLRREKYTQCIPILVFHVNRPDRFSWMVNIRRRYDVNWKTSKW